MSKFPENAQLRTSDDFQERLKLIIEDSECTSNRQFAELVGVSVPVIAKAVNFGIVPSLRSLLKIVDRLNLPLKYLLGIDGKNELVAAAVPSTFYDRLEELADERHVNYGQLASKMDFPRTYIYEWMKERTLPSVEYVLEIAEFFVVSPDYLLGRTDYKN